MARSNEVKTHSHDVRRQLFMGITKKIKTGSSTRSSTRRSEDAANLSVSDQHQAQPPQQFLHPSNAQTLPKSTRSKRISQYALTPTSTYTSNNHTINSSSTSSSSSMSVDSSSIHLEKSQILPQESQLEQAEQEEQNVELQQQALPQTQQQSQPLRLQAAPSIPHKKVSKEFVLHKKGDIGGYDYHTFSSTRSIRTSKIRALEQAEMTTALYFDFEANNGVEEAFDGEEENNVLICLPGMDRASSRSKLEQLEKSFSYLRGRP